MKDDFCYIKFFFETEIKLRVSKFIIYVKFHSNKISWPMRFFLRQLQASLNIFWI